MSQKDGELMHLTAESTGRESRSLVTQSLMPDGEIKIGKSDAIKALMGIRKTEEVREREGQRRGQSLPPCAQHIF